MKQDTYIVSNWQREQVKVIEQQKDSKAQRFAALKEFKESICDLFDMADFYYYAERIGCNVSYVLRIAQYSTDANYIKYVKPTRDIQFRRWFYINNGYSITKHPD